MIGKNIGGQRPTIEAPETRRARNPRAGSSTTSVTYTSSDTPWLQHQLEAAYIPYGVGEVASFLQTARHYISMSRAPQAMSAFMKTQLDEVKGKTKPGPDADYIFSLVNGELAKAVSERQAQIDGTGVPTPEAEKKAFDDYLVKMAFYSSSSNF